MVADNWTVVRNILVFSSRQPEYPHMIPFFSSNNSIIKFLIDFWNIYPLFSMTKKVNIGLIFSRQVGES